MLSYLQLEGFVVKLKMLLGIIKLSVSILFVSFQLICIILILDNLYLLLFAVSIQISNFGSIPRAGHTYNLTCSALGVTLPSTAYQWSKGGGVLEQGGPNLSFPSLRLSDAGEYRCTVTVDSRSDRNSTSIVIMQSM